MRLSQVVGGLLTKRCSKCGEIKPFTEFFNDRHAPDGKCYPCKACSKAYSVAYRASHKDKCKATRLAYYTAHRDECKANNAIYSAGHKDERAASDTAYRASHRDEIRTYGRAYSVTHKDERKASNAHWQKEHPERKAASCHNRRVFLGSVRLTADVIQEVKAEYGGLCPYCNRPILKGHIDHIVPVSKGGTNERDNLVWACAPCNESKRNKSLLEFMIARRVSAPRV